MKNKRNDSKKKISNNKGISLIALVITVIVLLILAAVVLGTLQQQGVIGKAKEAKEKYNNSVIDEMAKLNNAIEGGDDGTYTITSTGFSGRDIQLVLSGNKLIMRYQDEDSVTHEEVRKEYEMECKIEDGKIYIKDSGSSSGSGSGSSSDRWDYFGRALTLSNGTQAILYEGSGSAIFAKGDLPENNNSITLSGTYSYTYRRIGSEGHEETGTYQAIFESGNKVTFGRVGDSSSSSSTYQIFDDYITFGEYVGSLTISNGEVTAITINDDPDEDPWVLTK